MINCVGKNLSRSRCETDLSFAAAPGISRWQGFAVLQRRVELAPSGLNNQAALARVHRKRMTGRQRTQQRPSMPAGGPRAMGMQREAGAENSLSVRSCSNIGSVTIGAAVSTGFAIA